LPASSASIFDFVILFGICVYRATGVKRAGMGRRMTCGHLVSLRRHPIELPVEEARVPGSNRIDDVRPPSTIFVNKKPPAGHCRRFWRLDEEKYLHF
jgi:hypothetical protein